MQQHANPVPSTHSVAEIAEKPLYRVTCGDIGTDPDSVERYLNGVLYLGKMWNCGAYPESGHLHINNANPPVILFDEADVFLEERDLYDLARNSIVSGKLHSLSNPMTHTLTSQH